MRVRPRYFFLGALFLSALLTAPSRDCWNKVIERNVARYLATHFFPALHHPPSPGVGRERPQKQGCHETVVEAKIAPILNAHRNRRDPPRDLRFAAYSRDTVDSNRAKFSQPAFDSF